MFIASFHSFIFSILISSLLLFFDVFNFLYSYFLVCHTNSIITTSQVSIYRLLFIDIETSFSLSFTSFIWVLSCLFFSFMNKMLPNSSEMKLNSLKHITKGTWVFKYLYNDMILFILNTKTVIDLRSGQRDNIILLERIIPLHIYIY